jgi:transposase InsO family protein
MGLFDDLTNSEENPQMHLHANAKLTPALRRLLVHRVRKLGWRVAEAAAAVGVARQTAYKWLARYEAEGPAGLEDRSCRPHRIRRMTPRRLVQRMVQLRRRKKAAWEIAEVIGVPTSTVSRHLKAEGLGRLWRIEQATHPPQRYEHKYPGSLFHVDAKRFGRIERIGHAIHGDYRRRSRGAGWEVVFVCIDDYTRLAYSEVHPSENAVGATRFFRRALRWFESLGVRCERLLTDNARCYSSTVFKALCAQKNVRQGFTRPYTPRTNGKAERFIQTLKRRWAYRHAYRSSAIRAASLQPWVTHYNHHRPHRALGKVPPIARLRASRQQRV